MLVVQITIPIKGMKSDLQNRQPVPEQKKKKEKTVTFASLLKKAMEN